jgi:hypothetical protein
MRPNKPAALFFVLLFSLACSLPNGGAISGPTVEPPVPASGSVLFQDDFSNPSSGWDRVTEDNGKGVMDYDSGVYRIQVSAPDYNFWATPGKNFTDVRIEVDTAKIGGPDSNRAGIVCRVTGEQFYFFVITSDGFFAIGRTNGTQSTLLGQTEMAQSANIKTGLAINHLRADCVGRTLSFYVNGFLVAQTNDSTLTSGDVGLVAGAFTDGAVDIIFDQFIVIQP